MPRFFLASAAVSPLEFACDDDWDHDDDEEEDNGKDEDEIYDDGEEEDKVYRMTYSDGW